ncbi:MAG: ABC transporter transmembrane domain-containing protein, partial [Myxococcales bacterium]
MPNPAARPAEPRPSFRRFPIRRLLTLARTEKRNLVLGTICLALGSAMSLVYPQAIRIIIDNALGTGDRGAVDRATAFMVGVFAVQGVAIALRYVLFTISGERIVARLREDLYRSLIRQEIGFFDERRTGELVSRLASDTTVLQNTVSANVSMVLRNLAATVGGIALLFWTSPTLTLLMLAVVPPVAAGAVLYGRKVRGLSKALQDSLATSSEIAEESLSGVRTVRAFAAEEAESARYGRAVNASFEIARKRAFVAGSFFGGASFAAYAAAAVVLWYGSRLVMNGALSIGELTSFLMYTLIVAFSLGALGELWTDFMKAVGAGERVFELLDRVPASPTSGGRTLPQ